MKEKARILALVLGIGFSITGLFAFVYPDVFFGLLPSYYGDFNLHFTKDAGIAFFSSGSLILLSLKIEHWKVPLTLGGTLFVILHGLFHVQMLFMGMAPTIIDVIIESFVIILPSLLSVLLLVLQVRTQE